MIKPGMDGFTLSDPKQRSGDRQARHRPRTCTGTRRSEGAMFVGQILVVAGAIPESSFTNSPVEPEHFQNMLLLGFGLKPTFFGSFSHIFPWFAWIIWIEIHPKRVNRLLGPLRTGAGGRLLGPPMVQAGTGRSPGHCRSTEKQRGRIYHLEIFGCRHGHRNEYEKWDKDGLYIYIYVIYL